MLRAAHRPWEIKSVMSTTNLRSSPRIQEERKERAKKKNVLVFKDKWEDDIHGRQRKEIKSAKSRCY